MEGKETSRRIVIILTCFMFAGCAATTTKERLESVDYGQNVKSTGDNSTQTEDEVTYSIINSDTYLDWKRSLDVRLNKKVSERTLRTIALRLKAQDPRNYERTFICYYLPDMKVGSGAWATTHFDPNLEIKILGLTSEEENALKQLPDDSSREIIGSWLDQSIYIGGRITIFHRDKKLFMETIYKDSSSGTKEIVEKQSGKGRAFQRKEGSSVGEYYLIDKQGNLQFWDEEGFILTAKKISSAS